MAKTKASESASISKTGRPEILTEELARKIVKMIVRVRRIPFLRRPEAAGSMDSRCTPLEVCT